MWRQTVTEWLRKNQRPRSYLARLANLSEAHLNKLCLGHLNPSPATLRKLEAAMGSVPFSLREEAVEEEQVSTGV